MKGKILVTVVADKGESYAQAAAEFCGYVRRMTGVTLPRADADSEVGGRVVRLHVQALCKGLTD